MKQIVKVQTSLFTSDGSHLALVYNEDKSVMGEMPVSKEILDAMNGELKAFFWAEIPSSNKFVEIELIDEAPWQDW